MKHQWLELNARSAARGENFPVPPDWRTAYCHAAPPAAADEAPVVLETPVIRRSPYSGARWHVPVALAMAGLLPLSSLMAQAPATQPAPAPAPEPKAEPKPEPKPQPAPTPKPAEPAKPQPAPAPKPVEPAKPQPAPAPKPAEPAKPQPAPAPKPAEPAKPQPAPAPKPAEPAKPQPAPAPKPAEPAKPQPAPAPKPAEPAKPQPAPAPKPAEPAKPQPAPAPKPAEAKKPEPAPKPEPKPSPNPTPDPKKPAPEVKKAEPAKPRPLPAGSDADVIKAAENMPIAQTLELLEGYLRKNNAAMVDKLVGLVLKKDPGNQDLKRLLREAQEAKASANDTDGDDPAVVEAEKLVNSGRAAKAVAVLKKLRADKFKGQNFPYLDALADAQAAAGDFDAAEATYRQLMNDPGYSDKDRTEAEVALHEIAAERLYRSGQHALAKGEHQHALDLANRLISQDGRNWQARLLRAEALMQLGRVAESEKELQAIASNPRASLDARRDAKQELNEQKVDRLLEIGNRAIDYTNRSKVMAISEQLDALAPNDPEVIAFRADALALNGRYDEAISILEKLRDDSLGKNPTGSFAQLPDLAYAYEGAGRYREAESAFRQVAMDAIGDPVLRREAIDEADSIASRIRGGIFMDSVFVDEGEGQLWTQNVVIQSPVYGLNGRPTGTQISVRGTWDHLSLAGSATAARSGSSDLFEGEVTVRQLLGRGYYAEAGAGATSNGEGLFHAEAGRLPLGNLPGWNLRYAYNERALDSLSLRALDGRQQKVSFNIQGEIAHRWRVDASVYWRQVDIDGTKLGDGYGFNAEIDYIAMRETPNRPEVTIGYFGEYSRFDPSGDRSLGRRFTGDDEAAATFAEDLVDRRFNRHGVQIGVSKQLNDRWSVYANAGVAFDFEQDEAIWRAGAGAAYRFNDRVKFNIGADYESSGRAGNSGSGVTTGVAGLQILF